MDLRGWREASSVRRCVVSTWLCPGSVQEALQVLLGWSPHRGNPWAALGTQGRVFDQCSLSEHEWRVLWEIPLCSEPLEEGSQEQGVAV